MQAGQKSGEIHTVESGLPLDSRSLNVSSNKIEATSFEQSEKYLAVLVSEPEESALSAATESSPSPSSILTADSIAEEGNICHGDVVAQINLSEQRTSTESQKPTESTSQVWSKDRVTKSSNSTPLNQKCCRFMNGVTSAKAKDFSWI